MKDKVLVVGGMGYIGSHTVVELMTAGYEPIILDNLSHSHIAVLEGISNITGRKPQHVNIDATDAAALDAFFRQNTDIKAVIDFAAYIAVEESVRKPLMYYQNNIVLLLNILDSMKRHGVDNVIFSSSCTVYGEPGTLPVTEQTPTKPATSPYGSTKQMSETIIRDVCASDVNLHATLLRYFNPIGAHESGEIGELPHGVPSHILPYITQTAAGIREQLSVFGGDYDTPDGSCVRDYIDVVDLAKAHVAAVRRMIEKKNTESVELFNIGTGEGLSVLQLITAFEKATGIKINYKITDRRAGDIEKVWADATKANTVLGWKALTPIETTLANAWNWETKMHQHARLKGVI